MKIPVLTALALLLALVGAYDADGNEEINLTDDRRLAYDAGTDYCKWRSPYWYNGKCYKVEWCWDWDKNSWEKESDEEISWIYCWKKGGGGGGGGGGSSNNKNLKKKCRRWERKYRQCKRHKPTSNVSFVELVSSWDAHVQCSSLTTHPPLSR